ncbi:hypothetical protein DFH09DRAFT_1118141 [Mycena vulgaris]|nr:hypothetical protein DFH09DRAFT_1118141 [Mycena vulgaris]
MPEASLPDVKEINDLEPGLQVSERDTKVTTALPRCGGDCRCATVFDSSDRTASTCARDCSGGGSPHGSTPATIQAWRGCGGVTVNRRRLMKNTHPQPFRLGGAAAVLPSLDGARDECTRQLWFRFLGGLGGISRPHLGQNGRPRPFRPDGAAAASTYSAAPRRKEHARDHSGPQAAASTYSGAPGRTEMSPQPFDARWAWLHSAGD